MQLFKTQLVIDTDCSAFAANVAVHSTTAEWQGSICTLAAVWFLRVMFARLIAAFPGGCTVISEAPISMAEKSLRTGQTYPPKGFLESLH